MDETAATATASASMDAAAPHEAKATQDQGHQPATSASAPSATHDHPGEDAMMADPPRLSEDPVDTMGIGLPKFSSVQFRALYPKPEPEPSFTSPNGT